MKDIYKIKASPLALKENIIQGEKYRITVLTSGLLRLEYNENGIFEDRPTQTVLNRDFKPAGYQVVEALEQLEIITERVHLVYNGKDFSNNGLSIQVKGRLSAYHSIWRYSDNIEDLKGTARTLDMIDGAVELEHGVISKFGYSIIDDSSSLILTNDGWVEPRQTKTKDIYFFGYGHDYLQCLKDFYYLCGKTPMLPRYALGNWWSRYYKYTEESYMELMDRFDEERIPFSVAVIDMDWHIVDVDPKYGSGWTGYTWNRELFPNPERFLDRLHKRGMKTTLNVHPAGGVQGYEEAYENMAKSLGIDYEKDNPILFDASDPEFMEAYFEYLHHPHEREGVDFWWIDWQQGASSKVAGLDPLWILNHYHFLDSKKNGKRPMTFSRYAGAGSHRYPVGFSGDSITTWESLDFQPYFTATASNIGYGWWSHDIGGHMLGYKNDEMVGRWVQFGVFSPIMRLHSSCSIFNGKEPWRFKSEIREVMGRFLRLRHKLLPYLYTMNYLCHKNDTPLTMPMYYLNPNEQEAYEVPNEYYFGEQIIAAPITTPRIKSLNVSKTLVWLPKGTFIDLFTGTVYSGDRKLEMYRDINTIPVLVRSGGIIPMTDEIFKEAAITNPQQLNIKIFAGADGSFTLYEDDNETCGYEKGINVLTDMEFKWDGTQQFVIGPSKGEISLIPSERGYELEFIGCTNGKAAVKCGDIEIAAEQSYSESDNTIKIIIPKQSVTDKITVEFLEQLYLADNDVIQKAFEFLNQAEIEFVLKERLYGLLKESESVLKTIAQLKSMNLEEGLLGALIELLTAKL